MRWMTLIAGLLMACSPHSPTPLAFDEEADPFLPPERPAKTAEQRAEDDASALLRASIVGCSRCSDDEGITPRTYQFLMEVEGLMQTCKELGGGGMWQARYTVPGRTREWRRYVVGGGVKTRRCMQRKLKTVKWPAAGWSARVAAPTMD